MKGKAKESIISAALPILVTLLVSSTVIAELSPQSYVGVGGVVVDREVKPLEGVTVVVYDSSTALVGKTSTGVNGMFAVTLPSGTYTLKLSKAGYIDKTISFSISKTSFYTDLGTITLDYSLSISMPYSSVSVNTLSTASIPVTISNKGGLSENISVELETDCNLDLTLYSGNLKVSALSLNPGETQTLTLKVKVPYRESSLCNVIIRFKGSIIHERKLNIFVENNPLSLISAQLTSIQSAPGSVMYLPFKVVNTLSEAFKARIYLELPSEWSGVIKDSSGNMVSEVQLNPGESLQLFLTLGVPRDASPGSYNITLRLEGITPFFVNDLQFKVSVSTGKPLVRLSTGTPHVDAYAGKTAKYQLTLVNLGDASCLANVTVSGLPKGYNWVLTDVQGNALSQIYLPAGGSSTLTLSVSVPPLVEPTVISFKVNATTSFSRDELPLSLGVLGRYELSFVTQNFYLELTPGSSGVFEIQVRNTGYSSLTNVALSLLNTPSGFSVNVEPINVPLLKPGEVAAFNLNIATEATVDTGDYYVTFMVKADQLDPIRRDLHTYLKTSGNIAYVLAAVIVVLVLLFLVSYRLFGRR
ncbi:MAG: NEW3 domain-containing protein [Thermofilaceae archaeon]|nr:NEW3 domain-containing protein [Thermofilaceae archaeon]MCX8180252.1 NEW3 domain-containing protein [Thermofilaceae archaeon]MDW8004028.1 NEW3 domain-containing protein [Thermofilaceae archaeon]